MQSTRVRAGVDVGVRLFSPRSNQGLFDNRRTPHLAAPLVSLYSTAPTALPLVIKDVGGWSHKCPSAPMSQTVITLYDIRSTIPQPWAPLCRFILNYKRLPDRTIWIEFADVESTLRTIGAPAASHRPDGRPVYTLPVIVDPLRSCAPYFPRGISRYASPFRPQRLPERSQAHFRRGNTSTPNAIAMGGQQREHAWTAVKEQFNFLAMILDKNHSDGSGVIAMGRDVTYADFAVGYE